ncbi:hypothetical protein C8R45DRAFT_524997 [Mycena sanguinolenta]|nr:hypothetical protein C8R45DRAFT_524997 [Mycena sanguinolenta]
MSIATSRSVNLGSVFKWALEDTFNDVVEIAWLPNAELWSDPSFCNGWSLGEFMADGWTRLKSNDIDRTARVRFSTLDDKFWLSQANHILTALQISSDFQHYVVSDCINFELTISTGEAAPKGFLFLCPPQHFKTGQSSLKWPECAAYWSLDQSGAGQLTPEDAANLGFPSFVLSTNIRGFSWDASVYAGLRQFHKAKSFDPDSKDVARHLGHKLYELSGLFAHIDEYYGDDTSQYFTNVEFDYELDTTSTNHVDFVPASTHQDMAASSFEEIVDSTSASTASSLFSTNWEIFTAGTRYGYSYGYDSQPNQYLSTSDFSTSDFNFDSYDFGNDLSWLDYSTFNDTVPSAATLNHQPPMLHDAAQFFPSTSLPQLPTSLPAASSFPIAPVVDAPVASSNLNYPPPMLHNAVEFFPATSFPQFPTGLLDTSSFHIAPIFDAPVAASNLIYQPPMLTDGAQFFTSLPQFPVLLAPSPFVVDAPVADTHSTVLGKRKMRDETDADLAGMVQGSSAPKAPKRFYF